MQKVKPWNKKYLAATFFVLQAGLLLSGCGVVSTTENTYVFDAKQAIDNPFPKDTLCPDKRDNYKGAVPDYFAQYQPNADLKAYIRMSPMQDFNDTDATTQMLKVAVYPVPFKAGYFFTPDKVQLEIAGQALQPTSVSKKFTQEHDLQEKRRGISREKLSAHSGEYLVYMLEFSITKPLAAAAILHVGGFDLDGKQVAAQAYNVNLNESVLVNWKITPDCMD